MKTVRMVKVSGSSVIAARGWNDGSMFITFKRSGKTYRYRNVTEEMYNDLVAAASIGTEFTDKFQNWPAKVVGQAAKNG